MEHANGLTNGNQREDTPQPLVDAQAATKPRVDPDHKSLSSLPPEILSHIFQSVCSSSRKRDRPWLEMLLSQVTSHWRNVALTTPQLWKNIDYLVWRKSPQQMVRAYLSRSGALPLQIQIVLQADITDSNLTTILQMLTPHLRRWGGLGFTFTHEWQLLKLLEIIRDPMAPTLQCLYICYKPSVPLNDPKLTSFEVFCGGAPVLSSIRLRGIRPTCCLPPLTAVTSLRLKEPADNAELRTSLRELTLMLNNLPTLTHLVLHGDYRHQDDGESLGSIELPSLLSLELLIFGRIEMYPLVLSMISAPLLQNLLLEAMVEEEIAEIAAHPPNFPSLRSLIFLSPPGENGNFAVWRNLIHAFPIVQHFTLSEKNMDAFLLSFHDLEDPLMPWPDLHTLTLTARSDHPAKMVRLLYSLVQSRISRGRPLQKLELSKSIMTWSSAEMEELRALADIEMTTLYDDLRPHNFVTDPSDDEE